MGVRERIRDLTGRAIMQVIAKPSKAYAPFTPSDPAALRRSLQPGDVLLIEGNQRVSTVIKYMTQSTWSHAALFVGDALAARGEADDGAKLVEVDLSAGCIAVPLTKYTQYTTRICRPVGLSKKACSFRQAGSQIFCGSTTDEASCFLRSGCFRRHDRKRDPICCKGVEGRLQRKPANLLGGLGWISCDSGVSS
jgi:hypothetical protein